jgi:hypothetical protein
MFPNNVPVQYSIGPPRAGTTHARDNMKNLGQNFVELKRTH